MKLASIEQILEIDPIEGADKIELLTILGWKVIAKKGEFFKGGLCIFIPIDTTIDPTKEYFKFLARSKDHEKRVKITTTKIRGVYSQGIALPISLYPYEPSIGLDIAEFLDVHKYEKENILIQSGTTTHFEPFPTNYISKSDEDNLKTKNTVIEELIGLETVITCKMDGSSMTIINNNNQFIVCSRNYIIDNGHIMYQFVVNEKIMDKIINFNQNLAIQGEFCGPKVNGNQMRLKNYKWYVFTIKNLDTNEYLNYSEMNTICKQIGLDMVPMCEIFKCNEIHDVQYFQDYANKITYTTDMNIKVLGEGIVVRPTNPIWSEVLNKPLSFKVINQNYKD